MAALLIASYHTWGYVPSGGIDIFLVIGGFLFTLSLINGYFEKPKTTTAFQFARLLQRLLPLAWIVASLIFSASLLYFPVIWRDTTINHFIASLFYFENLQLYIDQTSYVIEEDIALPFQHFWALSLQFQFYFIWLILFKTNQLIFKVKKSTLVFMIASLTLSSFIFSLFQWENIESIAYFHPFVRVWEFGVGALLAFSIQLIQLSKKTSLVISYFGLFFIVITGPLFMLTNSYPTLVLLLPIVGTLLLLTVSQQRIKLPLLQHKGLVQLGKYTFAFYLIHWPLLTFYRFATNETSIDAWNGFLLLFIAFGCSFIFNWLVEHPFKKLRLTPGYTLFIVGWMSGVILFSYNLWLTHQEDRLEQIANQATQQLLVQQNKEFPGATGVAMNPLLHPPYPSQALDFSFAARDRSPVYKDRCITPINETSLKTCTYGELDAPQFTIALIGGSHAAHWLPMLDVIGQSHQLKIVTYLKPRCRFQLDSQEDSGYCDPWFQQAMQQLIADQPDLVFTTGDIGKQQLPTVPIEMIQAWEQLNQEAIPLLVVRDNPWFPFHVLRCLEDNPTQPEACQVSRDEVIVTPSPFEQLTSLPTNVTTLDLTDYFCDSTDCHPVVGNLIAYFDSNHITASFSRTFAPIVAPHILKIIHQ